MKKFYIQDKKGNDLFIVSFFSKDVENKFMKQFKKLKNKINIKVVE